MEVGEYVYWVVCVFLEDLYVLNRFLIKSRGLFFLTDVIT